MAENQKTDEIKHEQRKLQMLGLYHRPIDGIAGDATQRAMQEFKEQADGKDLDDDVDRGVDDEYWPDADNVQRSRPYYLLTIPPRPSGRDPRKRAVGPSGAAKEEAARRERQRATIKKALVAKKPTDVFVLSHGWHRNFFVAISAYDRLISRFIALLRRDRLQAPPEFRPFFICVHWHSDPGTDSLVDPSGRRTKDAFITAALIAFDPVVSAEFPALEQAQATLLNLLEDLYEIFTYTGSPGLNDLPPDLHTRAVDLARRMPNVCRLRATLKPPPDDEKLPELICMAWRCYEEAASARVLVDQGESPRPFMRPFQAITALVNFAIGAAGVAAVLSLFNGRMPALFKTVAHAWATTIGSVFAHALGPFTALSATGQVLLGAIGAASAGWLTLKGVIAWRTGDREDYGAKSLPIAAIAGWALLQIPALLPLIAYAFLTYVFNPYWLPLIGLALPDIGPHHALYIGWLALCLIVSTAVAGSRNAGGLFTERTAGGRVTPASLAVVRDWLANLADRPCEMLGDAVAKDSSVRGWADGLRAQLAFYTMQVRGVEAGWDAAGTLAEIFDGTPIGQPEGPRLHLIGHSFGGLVISNMVSRFRAETRIRATSQILVQAAVASTWYSGVTDIVDGPDPAITGVLACIYSGYDTANGFLYPLANKGRMAAGSVGLCPVGAGQPAEPLRTPDEIGKGGIFASLVHPPAIAAPTPPRPFILNVDASRIIFEGPVALGGGHGDVYKDDVVYLVWSLCTA